MSDEHEDSGLSSVAGSPFKTKNFNKFFFGIVLFALAIVTVLTIYFLFLAKHA